MNIVLYTKTLIGHILKMR